MLFSDYLEQTKKLLNQIRVYIYVVVKINVTYQYIIIIVEYYNYYSIQQEPVIASSGESDNFIEEHRMVMMTPGNTSVSMVPNVLDA